AGPLGMQSPSRVSCRDFPRVLSGHLACSVRLFGVFCWGCRIPPRRGERPSLRGWRRTVRRLWRKDFTVHIDMPRRTDIERLAAARDPLSVSIYLPTSIPPDAEHDQLQARN